MGNFKLLVRDIYVNTNLEVQLKSRTTKEEANKEVERIIDKKRYLINMTGKLKDVNMGGSTALIISWKTIS